MTIRIGRVRVFQELEDIVTAELAALLGRPLRRITGERNPIVHSSVVPLTLVSDHLAVNLGLGVDAVARDKLRELLLGGDENCEAMLDALREMANTAGGAVCRVALDQGAMFTLGLPSNDDVFRAGRGKRREWAITDDDGLYLTCVAMLSENRTTRVAPSELRVGMALVSDAVHPITGRTVALANCALTQTAIDAIAESFDDTTRIEVAL